MKWSVGSLLVKLLVKNDKLHDQDDRVDEFPYSNFNHPKLLLLTLTLIIDSIDNAKGQKWYADNHIRNA
jgi:hypothetical protein